MPVFARYLQGKVFVTCRLRPNLQELPGNPNPFQQLGELDGKL
jgi:hypothetical protein